MISKLFISIYHKYDSFGKVDTFRKVECFGNIELEVRQFWENKT